MVTAGRYEVRRFRREDRPGVLSLLERTLLPDIAGVREAWFDWRFVENPYAEAVPVTVTLDGGSVVGVRSSLPVRLQVGDRQVPATYLDDAAVDPEHRRRGLFTRMTQLDHSFHADGEAAVAYSSPVPAARGAIVKLVRDGTVPHAVFGDLPKHYHLGGLPPPGPRWGRPLWRGGVRLAGATLDWLARGMGSRGPAHDVELRVVDGVPAERLLAISGGPPAGVHVVRDACFYQWRFGSPRFRYRTYLAARDGAPVAGAVVERPTPPRPDLARVVEVLPAVAEDVSEDSRPWLLDRIARAEDRPVIAHLGTALSGRTLLERGFLPGSVPPLSWTTSPTTFFARPVMDRGPADPDAPWIEGGVDLGDPDNWALSGADVNLG